MARNTFAPFCRAALLIAGMGGAAVIAKPTESPPGPPTGGMVVAAVAQVGNRGADLANAIAPGAGGGVVIGTQFNGTLSGHGADITAHGGGDVALIAFDHALAPRWSRQFGGTAHDEVRALARARGELAVGGFFVGEAGLSESAGSTRVSSQGGADGYVGFVDKRGVPRGLLRVGGKQADHVRSLVAMPGGDLLVGGHFQAASRLAPGAAGVIIGAGGTDVFVQRLGTRHDVRWARTFGGAGDDELAAIAALPDGGTLLLMRHDQPMEVRIGAEAKTFSPRGSHDALLLWLDANGTATRAVPFVSAGNDDLHLLGVGQDGAIVLAGEFQGTQVWPIGSPEGRKLRSRGSTDVVVFLLDPQGEVTAHHRFGSIGPDSADALAVSGNDFWLALGWQGRMIFDGGPALESVDTSAVLLRLDATGAVRDRLVFEGEGVQKITALAAESEHVWVAGSFGSTLEARGIAVPLVPAGKSDVFVARVDTQRLD